MAAYRESVLDAREREEVTADELCYDPPPPPPSHR